MTTDLKKTHWIYTEKGKTPLKESQATFLIKTPATHSISLLIRNLAFTN